MIAYSQRRGSAGTAWNAGPSTFLSRGKEGCERVLGIRWKVPSRGNRDGRWVWASGAGGAGSDFPRTWKTRHHGGGCSPAAAERGAFPTLPAGSPWRSFFLWRSCSGGELVSGELRVVEGAVFEHGAGDGEEPVADGAEGASVGVAAGAEGAVAGFAEGIVDGATRAQW